MLVLFVVEEMFILFIILMLVLLYKSRISCIGNVCHLWKIYLLEDEFYMWRDSLQHSLWYGWLYLSYILFPQHPYSLLWYRRCCYAFLLFFLLKQYSINSDLCSKTDLAFGIVLEKNSLASIQPPPLSLTQPPTHPPLTSCNQIQEHFDLWK